MDVSRVDASDVDDTGVDDVCPVVAMDVSRVDASDVDDTGVDDVGEGSTARKPNNKYSNYCGQKKT